jgi:hypothetical protein
MLAGSSYAPTGQDGRWQGRAGPSRREQQQEAATERTDWLDEGFDSAQAQFLMVTAITHHRFSSPLWGEDEVRKLQAELAEIEMAAAQVATAAHPSAKP